MLHPQSLTTFAALVALLAQAQQSPNNTNRAVDILPCNAIPNIDLSSGTVCERAGLASTGVGIAPDVFATTNTTLSLTLIDNAYEGGAAAGYQYSIQHLYAGVPPALAVADQPPACALTLQYQAQTLPNITGPRDNSTSCSDTFSDACLTSLTAAIRAFGPVESNATANRCAALAAHVKQSFTPALSFCNLWTAFVNITGGPLLGAQAPTSPVQLQRAGSQPVLPADRELRAVLSATQLFRPGGDEFADADSEANEYLPAPVRGAGRGGKTPVVGVFYAREGDREPGVQVACLRALGPEGGELVDRVEGVGSGAGGKGGGGSGWGVLGLGLLCSGLALGWSA